MANRVNNMRRRTQLLEQASNQEEAKKSTMASEKNAWFSGTEALREEERKREDLILQGGLGAQKPKGAKAEAAENRSKVKTLDQFIEEAANRHRAARDNLKNVTVPAEVLNTPDRPNTSSGLPKPSDQQKTRRGPAPALPQKTMGAEVVQSADQLPSFPFDNSPRFGASQSDQRSESDTPQVECEAEFNTQVGFDGQVRHYLSEFDDTLRQDSTFMWIPEEPSQKTIVDFKLGIAPQIYGFLISSQVDLKKFPSQLRVIAQNGVRDLKNRNEWISVKMMACLWNKLYLNSKFNGVSADIHQYKLELQMWTTYVNPDPESFRGINPKGKSDLCHKCSEAGHAWDFCTQTCRWCHWCSDFY
ncbi:uncharacterized protein EAF02_003606 [Botrytis sinoallii]|uniref:uncharacterized protein n=1 Tax=Botrytis sinoallii TaxID=1463999 RepID=UPI0019008895|nr:uncharacterized protein EAF02_003606 [Botrytis sinoallii]KAF7886959.1 hypothetical protein EAF02_003606 [Botrytis sinoallii]